jgi:pyridinium-3,5-bisthiocarboxylic acid mononucleotide nickel chelatase
MPSLHLHLECDRGISGDMFLAGLAGLGLDLAPLAQLLGPAVVTSLQALPEVRQGIAGTRLHLNLPPAPGHRHLPDILALIQGAALHDSVRRRAEQAFQRLAAVEAAVHNTSLDRIHFHEVGASDTIVDVCGAFWGLERLGVGFVSCAPLPWFRGRVRCAHGDLPLPAPATTLLLQGKPVYHTDFEEELITPTGALLLDQIVDSFTATPSGGRLTASSLAYGSKDPGGGVRMFLFEQETAKTKAPPSPPLEHVWVLESSLDHLSGEDLGHAFELLFEAGALDVLYLPGVGKKNRPAGLLQVVCDDARLAVVQDAFLRATLTLGLRRRRMERVALPRWQVELHTSLGPVQAKEARYGEERWTAPEYEALRLLAKRCGKSVAALRRELYSDKPAGTLPDTGGQ